MGQRWGGRQEWASCRAPCAARTAHEPSVSRGAAVQRVSMLAHPQGDGLRWVWQSAPAPPQSTPALTPDPTVSWHRSLRSVGPQLSP